MIFPRYGEVAGISLILLSTHSPVPHRPVSFNDLTLFDRGDVGITNSRGISVLRRAVIVNVSVTIARGEDCRVAPARASIFAFPGSIMLARPGLVC